MAEYKVLQPITFARVIPWRQKLGKTTVSTYEIKESRFIPCSLTVIFTGSSLHSTLECFRFITNLST